MKKFFWLSLKVVLSTLLGLVLVLGIVEATFRFAPDIFQKKQSTSEAVAITRKALTKKVQARIYKNWSRKRSEVPNPFYLPWVAFENINFKSEKRLEHIVKQTKFPPNGNWEAYNVFRSSEEKESTKYNVKTNSFGFRDLERSVEKPKKTFRIVVLGSYITFGFALNDEETFVRKLEVKLNKAKFNNLKYEVWNVGRQGSTAIQGYALLKKEIMQYKPDLILFDYGWADPFTNSDSVGKNKGSSKNNSFYLKQKLYYGAVKICYTGKITGKMFGTTEICARITERLSEHQRVLSMRGWKQSLVKVAEFAKENKMPILFLNQAPHMKADIFKPVIDVPNNIFFLDTVSYINSQKITEEIKNEFWSKTNWLNEVGIKREEIGDADYIYVRNDAIQYNQLAHDFMSDRIFVELTELIPKFLLKNKKNVSPTR